MNNETVKVRKEWLESLLKLAKKLQEKSSIEPATFALKIVIAEIVGYISSIESLLK